MTIKRAIRLIRDIGLYQIQYQWGTIADYCVEELGMDPVRAMRVEEGYRW